LKRRPHGPWAGLPRKDPLYQDYKGEKITGPRGGAREKKSSWIGDGSGVGVQNGRGTQKKKSGHG